MPSCLEFDYNHIHLDNKLSMTYRLKAHPPNDKYLTSMFLDVLISSETTTSNARMADGTERDTVRCQLPSALYVSLLDGTALGNGLSCVSV